MPRIALDGISLALNEWPGRGPASLRSAASPDVLASARFALSPRSLGSPSAAPRPATPAARQTIVCIHGLTANHTCWASMADVLAPAFRLIAYDLRGRGDSDKPEKGYSLEAHGEDLGRLLDHYGLEKAVLMGHSLGAHIAIRFAVNQPSRVSKLVLFDGGLGVRAEILDSLRPAINRLGVVCLSLALVGGKTGLPRRTFEVPSLNTK